LAVFRRLAPKNRVTDDNEVEILRGLSARAALKRVGVTWWQVPLILAYGRRSMRQRIGEAKVFPGMKETLHELHARGHHLFILSTNKTANVNRFLSDNGLERYFEQVYAGIGLFAKARNLRKIMQKHHLKVKSCYYIGDEVRDYEASHQVGMRCISVAWGYNNQRALEAAGVEAIVRQPKELLTVLK
jgi:phosphoglycolate phosphatase